MAEKKKKEVLTPEEKKQRRKEKIQGALVAIGFCILFLFAFGMYGLQSSIFGR